MKTAIVVGAGISGCLMSYLLTKRGVRVYCIDKGQEHSASSVAAGIINPITGKNYIKSWQIDVFLPKAKEIYRQWEQDFNKKVIHEMTIRRRLPDIASENIWESRKLDPEYQKYVIDENTIAQKNIIEASGLAYASIGGGMRVDVRSILAEIKRLLYENESYLEEKFDYALLKKEDQKWNYKNITADHVVFCEGAGGIDNPYFPNQPYALTKGYALEIDASAHSVESIYKDDIFMVPMDSDTVWAGGAYSKILEDAETDNIEFERINNKWHHWYSKPYEVKAKKFAIRPTTKHRRPLVFQHDTLRDLFFFNGMGTKGTSMAPYFAEKLTDFICGENNQNFFSSEMG